MTTQGAGPDGSQLDLDEADRLAESIRPAWELDDGQHAAPPVTASAVVDVGLASGGVDAAALDEAAKSFEPPRDTVIDGSPLVPVGKTDPGAAPSPGKTEPAEPLRPSQLDPAKRPVPPRAPRATRLGLGTDDERLSADALPGAPGAAEPPKETPEKLEVTTALPVKDIKAEVASDVLADEPAEAKPASERAPRSKRRTSKDAVARPSSASKAPAAGSSSVSFSKVDDPVELPVEKSKTSLYVGGALALVAVLGIGGYLAMSGDDPPKTETTAPAKTQAAEPTPAKAPDPKPTATQTAAPAPTAPATAEATATATATATAAPTSAPVADAKPSSKPEATTTKPAGGGKPAGGSGGGGKKGGIMRDAPF